MNSQSSNRRIRDLIDGKHSIYLYLATEDAMKQFRRQAKNEWIRFGDGAPASRRKPKQIMRLLDDGTVCYVGFAGAMRFYHSDEPTVLRVDFEKYMAGDGDYFAAGTLLLCMRTKTNHETR